VIHQFDTAALAPDTERELRRLMDQAFAGDPEGGFEESDWQHALGGRHVIAEEEGMVVAHAAVVPRLLVAGGVPLRTGYVEAVATLPGRQGAGYGTAVMRVVGVHIAATYELGGLGTGAFHFYERLGWRRWPGPTAVRRSDGRIDRSPDDDGYVMILRTPSTPPLDQDSTLTCEDRPGDAW